MPRYVDDAEGGAEFVASVPGIYASLLPWAESEYARSGDPRWRYSHDDGAGGTCRGDADCVHGDPPPNPKSSKRLRLEALTAGWPVRVSHWIASGRRWRGPDGWSGPEFSLPWDERVAPFVTVSADDTVRLNAYGRRSTRS
ncbi:hypothetical protein EV580_3154 [Mycobacterium sp. BK086]|nr:hypothetical protein EV580_3154 [Mycobacterium sp. BK086]